MSHIDLDQCEFLPVTNAQQRPPPTVPQDQYAVKIILDDADQAKFPIGAQGTAAIYTSGESGAWAALRRISIRAHSWLNWLYPLST